MRRGLRGSAVTVCRMSRMTCGSAFFQANERMRSSTKSRRWHGGWRKRKQASRTPNAIASFRNQGEPDALRCFDVHAIARNVWSALSLLRDQAHGRSEVPGICYKTTEATDA